MSIYLGIDLGTTKVAGVVYDYSVNRVLKAVSLPHNALSRQGNRYEIDPAGISRTGLSAIETLCQTARPDAIAISTQMHSCMFVDSCGRPLTSLVTWLDKRCSESCRGSSLNYIEKIWEVAGGKDAFEGTGTDLSLGFMGPTVFWFNENGLIPEDSRACFLGDYFASLLTGEEVSTDITCAGSSGFYDIRDKSWLEHVIEGLGIPSGIFPPVKEPGTIFGETVPDDETRRFLPRGVPVFRSLGDNQASIIGAAGLLDDSVLVNIGTGSQVSVKVSEFTRRRGLDTRYFFDNSYVLVGAGVYGGRALALMHEFFREAGEKIYGVEGASLYDRLDEIMGDHSFSADDMVCGTFFSGTREDPSKRAFFAGITENNFHMENIIFSLISGIVFELKSYHERAGIESFSRLVGAGNALRQNLVLRKITAGIFGRPLNTLLHEEEAALGSCLLAVIRNEKGADIERLVNDDAYRETPSPSEEEVSALVSLYEKYKFFSGQGQM